MKTAVYDRFWSSRGGGERYAGMIAQTLAQDGHEVDLLSPEPVDLDQFATHLSLDLTGVRVRVIKDTDETAIAAASADYDLFVNSTYMSSLVPRAAKSAYVCFFPTPLHHELNDTRRTIAKRLGRYVKADPDVRGFGFGSGWFPPEGGVRKRWSWSTDHGVLELPPNSAGTFHLSVGRPGADRPATVQVRDHHDTVLADITVKPEFHDVVLQVPDHDGYSELHFYSDTFSAAGDNRELGFALGRETLAAKLKPRSLLTRRLPWLLLGTQDLRFLEAYDSIVTISDYTQTWVNKLWQVDSDLLFPPIDVDKMRPEPVRAKTIITIGRFFDPSRGHSKRQLEMVQIFEQLVSNGQLDGWELHMVGGCEASNRGYYEKVMAASEGFPIVLHPNARREVLERLINSASIFWSATGLDEDADKHPWRNEHFGMTTAEAMAAGCVPVVIDRAGQQEIVREGVDGFRWNTIAEAVACTARVAGDEELRTRLAASSIARAAEFSDHAFSERWREICRSRDLLP